MVLLRAPFLNQAIQGDDYYYLTGAMHAQIDPLHPTHGQYVFLGRPVDMRGHPHPPLNMWILGLLLAVVGDIKEIPFHAAYMVFTLIAALSMLSLARRFTAAPLWATLLFLATPALVVNGNSLEADLPFLAFWMLAAALFFHAVDERRAGWLIPAGLALALAALAAYQAVVLIPVLAAYLLLEQRDWKPGWVVLLTPIVVLGGWQLFERFTGGVLPAGVLAGYLESYGLEALHAKLANAVGLTVQAGWLVFPALAVAAFWKLPRWAWVVVTLAAAAGAARIDSNPLFWMSFAVGLVVILWCLVSIRRPADDDELFLSAWVLIFFSAALVLFFAGSARYLLPMAAPVCLLVTRQLNSRRAWLAGGFVLGLLVALSLAVVNYQHWGGYRRFVTRLDGLFTQRRVWIDAEWGLRFYGEAAGGLPLLEGQPVRPGEAVITSQICYPIPFTTGGGALAPLASAAITSFLPLRIIGIGAKSGYSTVAFGYRPFDIVFRPIDRVRAQVVVAKKPQLSYLPMKAPAAAQQIVSGVYDLESGGWRWMGARGVVLLKRPPRPRRLTVSLYLPKQAPARSVRLLADGVVVARARYDAPGSYTLTSPRPVAASGDTVTVEIVVDRTFSPPGDQRRLGLVLSAVGFKQ